MIWDRFLIYRWKKRRKEARKLRARQAATATYAKAAKPRPPRGHCLAVGFLAGDNGLSRGYRSILEGFAGEFASLVTLEAADLTRDRLAERIGAGEIVPPDVLLILALPDTFERILPLFPPAFIAQSHRIGVWFWEMARFPPSWSFAKALLHEIWAPSSFNAEVFKTLGLPVKLTPPKPPALPKILGGRERWNVPAAAFLGLAIMDLRSCPARKNPLAHIDAWREAFGRSTHHLLIIKARFSRRTRHVRRAMQAAMANAPNMRLVEADLDDRALLQLQSAADVYLSLHRAEGYGLPMQEMLALGAPVLATGWSGNVDFMRDHPKAVLIPFTFTSYKDELGAYQEAGSPWAEPSVPAASQALRQLAAAHRVGAGQT